MANAIFTGLEKKITELGVKAEDSIDLSELSLIGTGEERAISFSLLGTNFLLTPAGEVVAIDGTEDDPQTYALVAEMKKSVWNFLAWRSSFIEEFGI